MTDYTRHNAAQLVFKVVPAAQWKAAVEAGGFAGSADDLRDGYIHFSSAEQVSGTLAKYFRGQADLTLVAFTVDDLAPHLKWEASRGGALFPHFYGTLPTRLALWSLPLPLAADGIPAFDQDLLAK